MKFMTSARSEIPREILEGIQRLAPSDAAEADESLSEEYESLTTLIISLIRQVQQHPEDAGPFRLVEFGCGNCALMCFAAASIASFLNKKIEYTAVEINPNEIRLLYEYFSTLHLSQIDFQFIAADASKLKNWFPTSGGKLFDGAIFLNPIIDNPKIYTSFAKSKDELVELLLNAHSHDPEIQEPSQYELTRIFIQIAKFMKSMPSEQLAHFDKSESHILTIIQQGATTPEAVEQSKLLEGSRIWTNAEIDAISKILSVSENQRLESKTAEYNYFDVLFRDVLKDCLKTSAVLYFQTSSGGEYETLLNYFEQPDQDERNENVLVVKFADTKFAAKADAKSVADEKGPDVGRDQLFSPHRKAGDSGRDADLRAVDKKEPGKP
jgi:hypothetical protein